MADLLRPARGRLPQLAPSSLPGLVLLGLGLLSLAGLLGACDPGGERVSLLLSVHTGLVPKVEFHSVRTELLSEPARSVSYEIGEDTSGFGSGGQRVAELDELPATASRRARVSLLNEAGEVVLARDLLIDNRASISLTVVLTRDCLEVACDEAPGLTCAGGRCAPEECVLGTEEVCPEPECVADADCAPIDACSRPSCVGAVCTYVSEASACAAEQICLPSSGCLSAPSLLAPLAGAATGSVHAPRAAALAEHPLRPLFRWSALEGAHHYELEVDDSCETAAMQGCAFESPEISESTAEPRFAPAEALPVSMTPPVGTRYFWRARACPGPQTCSPWSPVRHVDVGRQRGDFNGDGYADLAVGAMSQDGRESDEGGVFVYHGDLREGATPTRLLTNPEAAQAGAHFGAALSAAGDVDGDGYADLLVGAPNQTGGGYAFLFPGGPEGVTGESVAIANPGGAAATFGARVSGVGDLDGDGYADMVIGAPAEGGSGGAVYLLHGAPILGTLGIPEPLIAPPLPGGAMIGGAISESADVDGDGHRDLAVGAREASAGTGVALLYLGGPEGIAASEPIVLANPDAEAGSLFGSGLCLGDFDGDGRAELAVGAPRAFAPEMHQGRVHIFAWEGGLLESPIHSLTIDGATPATAYFGDAMSCAGDADGDGTDELLVGAPGYDDPEVDEGAKRLYFGSPSGIAGGFSTRGGNPDDAAASGYGGAVRIVGDVDGDGFDDVVIGAPDADLAAPSAGAFYFWSFGGQDIAGWRTVRILHPDAQPNADLGAAIAWRAPARCDARLRCCMG